MRQFWGYATGLTTDWMNENLPENAKVHFQNTTGGAYNMYKEEGRIREDIRIGWDYRRTDCLIFHEQRAFSETEYDIWGVYETMAPTYVASYRGVPMATVYCNKETRQYLRNAEALAE
jgi:hypothetical protein